MRHILAIVLALTLVVDATPQAYASDGGFFSVFTVSASATTASYGLAMTVGALTSGPSGAWQIHSYIAGSMNLTCGVSLLVVGMMADDDITLGMAAANLLVGTGAIMAGVFNAEKAPVVVPLYSVSQAGETTAGLQIVGQF